jgi:DNA-directed RNA polymerase specialized sigma24 family protein
MADTSFSLLNRLRLQPDAESWQRLVDLYTPLIQGWLRQHSVPAADAEDLTQEVMTVWHSASMAGAWPRVVKAGSNSGT